MALNHFRKLYKIDPDVKIKSTKTVDSIGAFLKNLYEDEDKDKDKHDKIISNLFGLSRDNPPLDDDIFEINNPRGDNIFFQYAKNPRMHRIPKSTVAEVIGVSKELWDQNPEWNNPDANEKITDWVNRISRRIPPKASTSSNRPKSF